MKAMTTRTMMPRRKMAARMNLLRTKAMRRAPNHNLHVMTPHGKLMAGRKGRTG
jgi:hypothetical protein